MAIIATNNNSNVVDRYKHFWKAFVQAKGATHILIVSTLYSFGIGSVIGLTPATLADRFAQINHGFSEDHSCSDYNRHDVKPDACIAGSQDAQNAAAWANVAVSLLMLLCNPVLGSLSDVRGRRPVVLLSLFVSCLPPAVFWRLQREPHLHPAWYYAASSLTGAVNYLSIVFAALSDSVSEEYRAPAYGVLLAGVFGGFAFAPSIPWVLHDDMMVGTISLALVVAALVLALVWLPETLPDSVREENLATQSSLSNNDNSSEPSTTTRSSRCAWWVHTASRPLREVSILNRDLAIRLLTIGSFFAAMVFAADSTLVIYYVEEQLDVQEADIAFMCFFLGAAGVIIQGGLLQPLIALFGEKGLLIISYICGAVHNFLYGAARSKATIYVALVFSQLTKTNLPLLSSLASKNVEAHEQGRVQGALFATNAIANAVGPLSMEYVQRRTQAHWGKGFMFTYAAGLYVLGTIVVSLIPVKIVDGEPTSDHGEPSNDHVVLSSEDDDGDDAEQPGHGIPGELHPNETPSGDLEEPLLSTTTAIPRDQS